MSRSPSRLVLFDIDGTLLSAGRSGYRALERAIVEVLGAVRGLEGIRLDGNTDLNALRQISERDGTPFPGPALLDRFKQHYVEVLSSEIVGKGHLHPGVEDLLGRLQANADFCVGLVTGNFQVGARIKLARFGIQGFFRIGAFGCEHHLRQELVRLAVSRGEASCGAVFPPDSVTMIGDTINDVAASRACGVRALAVATGSSPLSDLRGANPTWALENLSDVRQVESLLLS